MYLPIYKRFERTSYQRFEYKEHTLSNNIKWKNQIKILCLYYYFSNFSNYIFILRLGRSNRLSSSFQFETIYYSIIYNE